MLSPATSSSIEPLDELQLAKALPKRSRLGVAFQTVVGLGRRTVSLHGVRSPEPYLTRERFDDAVARRAAASGHRLLPVIASGHDGRCHWVAYEVGSAVSLAAEARHQWPVDACVDLISDVALVLDDATAQGLAPWELVPASTFFDGRFGALLSDLGTAREALGGMIVDGRDGGAFAPPEVRRGQGAGERSGVYVCGALLHQFLTGKAPGRKTITGVRPELPEDTDLVVARATARDSLERHRTARELCQSARRVLLDHMPAPETVEEEVTPDPAAAPLLYDWEPPPRRLPRVLAAAAVLLGLLSGVAVGLMPAGDGPASPPAAERAAAGGMVVTLPPGWNAGPRSRAELSAYPAVDGFSGLRVSLHEGAVDIGHDDPVRLGHIDFWRDASEAPSVVRYAAPTAGGTLVIACEASPGAVPGTLRECEQMASTLDPGPVRVLPLPGVTDDPGMWTAIERLAGDLMAGRRRLAGADRPTGQREVAAALARTHQRAARRLGDMPEAAAIAAAASEASGAYRALARAAGGRSSGPWNAARAAVRRSETALAEAIAAQSPSAP